MTKDLTQGNVAKAILGFALPMVIGNIFQQLYNVADTIIVGRYLGPSALAAVGSSFALMVFLTSIMFGLCMGASVLFSQLFGAKDFEGLKRTILTAFVFVGLVSLLINLCAILLIDHLLVFMNTPPDILFLTRDYLAVIFAGIFFTFLYNFFSCVLRSMGDSLIPLFFLVVSAIVNIILDIVFITTLNMGIAGAAYATIIAQALSGILTAIYCVWRLPILRYRLHELRVDFSALGQIINYSVLTGIQQSVMNFGILLIQGLVNSFGVTIMAAFAAAVKIDSFAYMPVQDFGNAFSTYIAQNKGAQQDKRIRSGIRVCLFLTTIFCIVISLSVILFSKQLMLIFIAPTETEIVAQGVQYLMIVGCFYFLIGYLFLFYGYFRGNGRPAISIVLTVISLGIRVALSYLLAPIWGVTVIWWAIPIGWLSADLVGFFLLAFLPGKKE